MKRKQTIMKSLDDDLNHCPNTLITEIYQTGAVRDPNGKNSHRLVGSAIPFDEGLALYNWIRRTKPLRTIEIGMAYGLSTLFICQAHADNGLGGTHIVIDPGQSETYHSIGCLNVERAGLIDQMQFFEAPSYQVLPRLLNEKERFQMVFIDGMHTFDYAFVDFFYADLLLDVNGYLVFDDVWMPSVLKAVIYVTRNRKYRIEPGIIYNPANNGQRIRNFISDKVRRKNKIRLHLKQFAQNPFDLLSFWYLLKIYRQGSLKYLGLQKLADDKRPWDYHFAF